MRSKLRVAVIGAGMIANEAHLPAWKNLPQDVEVVGVADLRIEAAQYTAKQYDIPHIYQDPAVMLDELQPDITSICTPNAYHKSWTIAALKAGSHVACEKPLTGSYADALEMFATADRCGKQLFPCQSMRFKREFMKAFEIASARMLGEVYYAEVHALRRRGIPTWGSFHKKAQNLGGSLMDLGVHFLDATLWLMGNPKVTAVSGQTYTRFGNRDEGLEVDIAASGAYAGVSNPQTYDYKEFDVEDFCSGFMRMENGATMILKVGWAANLPTMFNVHMAGTEGGLSLRPMTVYTTLGKHVADITPHVPPDREATFPGHWGMMANIVDVLHGEAEPVVKREEVLNITRAIEGIYTSSEKKKEITFD